MAVGIASGSTVCTTKSWAGRQLGRQADGFDVYTRHRREEATGGRGVV